MCTRRYGLTTWVPSCYFLCVTRRFHVRSIDRRAPCNQVADFMKQPVSTSALVPAGSNARTCVRLCSHSPRPFFRDDATVAFVYVFIPASSLLIKPSCGLPISSEHALHCICFEPICAPCVGRMVTEHAYAQGFADTCALHY